MLEKNPLSENRILLIVVDKILTNKLISKNPQLKVGEAENKIREAKKKYSYMLGNINSNDSIGRVLIKERNNLKLLNDLNISSEEENKKLENLENEFKKVQNEIVLVTGDNPDEVEKNMSTILFNGIANNFAECKKIMIEGPLISGFEETEDPKISNDKVFKFLKDTFGIKNLKKAKVGMITKDDEWRIYFSNFQKLLKLESEGIVKMERSNVGIAKNEENYIKAAMIIEEVTDPKLLKHNFKLRAEAGDTSGFAKFSLGRLGIEKSSDFDYLKDIPLESEDDKMRVYLLGTIAHEIIHRYQPSLSIETINKYDSIVEEENIPERKKYVSEYVVKHHEIYGNDKNTVLLEDMSEAVRIYVTNYSYLKKNYPYRLEFIEETFPFIKKDGATESILN